VLKREWPGLVRVAREANRILRRRGSQLARQETAVRIVAIAALHQAFVHAMMERLGKRRFHFAVAVVAKLRLRILHQVRNVFGMVRRMAIHAAHIVLQMLRPQEVAVIFSHRMAGQAALAGFLRGYIFENENL
jgi:hypothetical protein